MRTYESIPYREWIIAIMLPTIVFTTFGCTNQKIMPEIYTERNNTPSNTQSSQTEQIKSMPKLNISDCNELQILLRENISMTSIENEDAQIINNIIKSTKNRHSYAIFRFMPDQLIWFTKISKTISIQSLGTAIHESNHIIDTALTYCNNGYATYYFDGKVIKTDHKFGDSLKYSIVAEMLPQMLKDSSTNSRFNQYIQQNGSHAESDFSILLDEFVAYTGAASFDITILRSDQYSWLVDRHVAWLDVNPSGMTDFMIYTLAYLKALRVNYPEAYLKIKQQPKTLALLQTIWTAAEENLKSAYDLTQIANNGGILKISQDAIAAIYSKDFLGELDEFGLTHLSMNNWRTSYLNTKENQ